MARDLGQLVVGEERVSERKKEREREEGTENANKFIGCQWQVISQL